LEIFTIPGFYDYIPLEHIATIIESRANPGDTMHVYGCFEPVLYTLTGMSSPSRFFAEFALIDSKLAYRRSEWIQERNNSLEKSPPRFIVCFKGNQTIINLKKLLGKIYEEIERKKPFVLLEQCENSN
jgi:hypothetical protein